MDFQQIFGTKPEAQATAPGRVNLLGEHTDYNDGFVLPITIFQRPKVELGLSQDTQHHFYSQELEEMVNVANRSRTPEGFASYIFGCIQLLAKQGYKIPLLNLYVTFTVPIGIGLSSSAALEVATLKGLRSLLNLPLDDVQIAQIGQQAEIQYARLNCAPSNGAPWNCPQAERF